MSNEKSLGSLDRALASRPISALLLALVLALTAFTYRDVLSIPFFYSEYPGIARNPVVSDLGVFVERMVTPKGLLQRPLSVLSYALDYHFHGPDPRAFHATNLGIHLLNVALVFVVARHFVAAPAIAALIFGLHPLGTACVSQVFGRNYSMATVFALSSFALFLAWRPRIGHLRLLALTALIGCAVLTKQNLVVWPAILVWFEVCRDAPAVARIARSHWIRTTALMLGVAGTAAVMITLYAAPLSRTAPISPLAFFLSQLGNFHAFLRLYFVPNQTALTHVLPFYTNAWHPEIFAGGLLAGMILAALWSWRGTTAAFLVGAILLCLAPSNGFLPKNEVIREWRLYPSLPFFSIFVVFAAERTVSWSRGRFPAGWSGFPVFAGVVLWIILLGASVAAQNRVYQSGAAAWLHVARRYPGSADAWNNLGWSHSQEGHRDEAVTSFTQAAELRPDVFAYWKNLAEALALAGDRERAVAALVEANRTRERHGPRWMDLHVR